MKAWFSTHWFWLIFICLALVFGHAWLGEHDARLQSDATVKVSEANVAQLQSQVTANNADIASLKQQQATNDARAQQQLTAMASLIASVKTTPQAVQGIAQVSGDKVQPVAQPDGSMTIPAAQAVPLFEELAQGKQDAVSLTTCKSDLSTEQQVTAKTQADVDAETAIVQQKDNEIAALKKKPSFWHRVGSTLKQVGIGFITGYAAGKVLP